MGSPPGPHGCPPEERESVYDGWARVAARPESRGRPAARRALTSASSLHCGSEGNSSFTSSMVPGPGRVGAARGTAVRPAAPRAGGGSEGRRAGGRRADARRAHSEHWRTTGSRRLRQEGGGQGDARRAAMLRPSPSRRSWRPSDSRDPAQARAHNRLLPPPPTRHSQSQPTLADGPPPPPPGVSAPPPCPSASAQTRGAGPPAGRGRGRRKGGEVPGEGCPRSGQLGLPGDESLRRRRRWRRALQDSHSEGMLPNPSGNPWGKL